MARLDHAAVQRFFPDAADGAERRPVARRRCAAAQTDRDRSGETLFRLGAAASARQFGAVSAIRRSHRGGVHRTDAARRTDAGLAGAAAPPDFRMAQAARLASPFGYSCRDLWSGGIDRARPPRRRIALCPAEEIVLCRSCRTKAVLRALGFFSCHRRSRHYRASHLPERPRQPAACCRKPVCLGGGTVWIILILRSPPIYSRLSKLREYTRPVHRSPDISCKRSHWTISKTSEHPVSVFSQS